MNDPAAETRGRPVSVAVAVLVAVALTLLVLVVAVPHLWYGLHDITDIPVYNDYALRMANGERPYIDFDVEYPPLAIPLFSLPGHVTDPRAYQRWFSIQMGVITLLAAVATAITACRLWPRGNRAYVAAVLFAVSVALTGAIIVNRYDAAVALLIAVFLLCLSCRWYTAAAFALGLGFALKITPAAMLPLVLLLAGRPRRWAWPIAAFAAAAAAPFLPYLFSGGAGGLWHVFRYHLERPLQIESVLGTPMLFGQLVGAHWATYGWSHGSHTLVAPGVGLAANLSGGLTLLAVAGVYAILWRRRARLRATSADQPIAALALILALMSFGKVLSPQYFVWILPAWALVAARDRLLAVVGGLTLLLTQVEFPALYWRLLTMRPDALIVVVTRNVLLLVFFGLTSWRLWRLPEDAGEQATDAGVAGEAAAGAAAAAAAGD